jgi:hypothetical protein
MAIVEVGAWLGAGTQYLVRTDGPLFVFDRFRTVESEVTKAAAFGVNLKVGQDTLPFVKSHIGSRNVRFVKGNIRNARYTGPPIGLYVDDASKRPPFWNSSMRTFEPHFVSGTILILMDYDFEICECQRSYAVKWQMLERRIGGTCAAVFRVQ